MKTGGHDPAGPAGIIAGGNKKARKTPTRPRGNNPARNGRSPRQGMAKSRKALGGARGKGKGGAAPHGDRVHVAPSVSSTLAETLGLAPTGGGMRVAGPGIPGGGGVAIQEHADESVALDDLMGGMSFSYGLDNHLPGGGKNDGDRSNDGGVLDQEQEQQQRLGKPAGGRHKKRGASGGKGKGGAAAGAEPPMSWLDMDSMSCT